MIGKWSPEFFEEMKRIVQETVEKEVVQYIYEVMQDMIALTVYNAYSPTDYDRRGESDGGLGDITTYDYKIDMSENGFNITVFANTQGNSNAPNANLVGEPIDEVIVTGQGYSWEQSNIYRQQPYPRDFYKATLDNLILTGALDNIVRQSFKEKGINIK